jgi:hypothetical protein
VHGLLIYLTYDAGPVKKPQSGCYVFACVGWLCGLGGMELTNCLLLVCITSCINIDIELLETSHPLLYFLIFLLDSVQHHLDAPLRIRVFVSVNKEKPLDILCGKVFPLLGLGVRSHLCWLEKTLVGWYRQQGGTEHHILVHIQCIVYLHLAAEGLRSVIGVISIASWW